MNPESPKNPAEELELRVTALLLGELSEDEAAALRQSIAQDAELSRLHERLKFAIELTRETTVTPSQEEVIEPGALKLAPERRAKLLAAFAGPRIKLTEARRAHRRELLALAAMLAVLLTISSMLLPSLGRSKARAQRAKAPPGEQRLLVLWRDRNEKAQVAVSKEQIQDLDEARRAPQSPPSRSERRQPARYYATATPPANEPAPAAPMDSPSSARADVALNISEAALARGSKDAESRELRSDGGRIALPEVPRREDDVALRSNTGDALTDSKLPAANPFVSRFAWSAPAGDVGGGVGGPSVPQKTAESTGAKAQIAGGKDSGERKPADQLGAMVNLYSELAPPQVDPATGLPIQIPETKTSTVTGGGGVVLPQFTDPAWIGVTDRAVNGANLALVYRPWTNLTDDFSTFTDRIEPAPDAVHESVRRSITTQTGKVGNVEFYSEADQKKDFGVDSRGWRFDGSGQAAGEKSKAGAPVIADGIAANPATQPGDFISLEGTLASGPVAAREHDLEKLRQVRDPLASRNSQENDQAVRSANQVEIIDPAEADPAKRESFWKRLGGAFSSDVERSARIAVPKETRVDDGFTNQRHAGGYDPYWMQTEMEQIGSKTVLSKVAEKLNLNQAWAEKHGRNNAEDALGLLKEMTTVSQDPKSGYIDIKVKSDKPEEAARIANTIAEVYRDQRMEARQQATIRGVETLQKELADQEKKIAEAEQRHALANEERERESKARLAEVDRAWKAQVRNPADGDTDISKPATPPPVPQPEILTTENRFSTFSLNVTDVSFKLAAASLEKGAMPEPATVRAEEFINAFDYRDPEPTGSAPIAFAWQRARYPFAHDRDLVRFSVKTAASGRQPGRPLNLVLLLDNSGSMERADRLRIRQECLRVLGSQLQTNDRISVVAFARTPQLWVDGLPGDQSSELPQRVGGLTPQGGTNLEEAMNLAYQTALRHFRPEGVNRVVLLTDGAANLGDVEPESLKQKVEVNRRQGIALDCFGIGWEGYNDDLLEVLSRNGDGRYGFVNTPEAASSEFAAQLAGALKVAASDVKVQVEFNPRRVTAYRQMGYAKHQLTKEQFRDNTVDAAEIGAAEAGNALYVVQVNPRGEGPLGTVRVRFKVPGTGDYREHEWAVPYEGAAKPLEESSFPMRLAASAAAFSEWLVTNPYAAEVSADGLLRYLSGVPESCPADPRPKKLEWMIRQAKSVAGK